MDRFIVAASERKEATMMEIVHNDSVLFTGRKMSVTAKYANRSKMVKHDEYQAMTMAGKSNGQLIAGPTDLDGINKLYLTSAGTLNMANIREAVRTKSGLGNQEAALRFNKIEGFSWLDNHVGLIVNMMRYAVMKAYEEKNEEGRSLAVTLGRLYSDLLYFDLDLVFGQEQPNGGEMEWPSGDDRTDYPSYRKVTQFLYEEDHPVIDLQKQTEVGRRFVLFMAARWKRQSRYRLDFDLPKLTEVLAYRVENNDVQTGGLTGWQGTGTNRPAPPTSHEAWIALATYVDQNQLLGQESVARHIVTTMYSQYLPTTMDQLPWLGTEWLVTLPYLKSIRGRMSIFNVGEQAFAARRALGEKMFLGGRIEALNFLGHAACQAMFFGIGVRAFREKSEKDTREIRRTEWAFKTQEFYTAAAISETVREIIPIAGMNGVYVCPKFGPGISEEMPKFIVATQTGDGGKYIESEEEIEEEETSDIVEGELQRAKENNISEQSMATAMLMIGDLEEQGAPISCFSNLDRLKVSLDIKRALYISLQKNEEWRSNYSNRQNAAVIVREAMMQMTEEEEAREREEQNKKREEEIITRGATGNAREGELDITGREIVVYGPRGREEAQQPEVVDGAQAEAERPEVPETDADVSEDDEEEETELEGDTVYEQEINENESQRGDRKFRLRLRSWAIPGMPVMINKAKGMTGITLFDDNYAVNFDEIERGGNSIRGELLKVWEKVYIYNMLGWEMNVNMDDTAETRETITMLDLASIPTPPNQREGCKGDNVVLDKFTRPNTVRNIIPDITDITRTGTMSVRTTTTEKWVSATPTGASRKYVMGIIGHNKVPGKSIVKDISMATAASSLGTCLLRLDNSTVLIEYSAYSLMSMAQILADIADGKLVKIGNTLTGPDEMGKGEVDLTVEAVVEQIEAAAGVEVQEGGENVET